MLAASPAFNSAATMVTPVAVTASTTYSPQQTPNNLINGSGLLGSGDSLTRTHDNQSQAGTMWHSAFATVNASWLIFDLGTTHEVSAAYIWQMNQPCCLGRGVRTFGIFTSPNATGPITDYVGTFELAMGSGTTAEGVQTLSFTASNVRRVLFAISNDWNAASSDYVGLSEVRFDGTAPAAIAQQPRSATNYVDGVHTFSVTAAGTAPLTYQWYKKGVPPVPIPAATNASYTIDPVGTTDAGDYFVTVANAANSVTSSVVTLTILNPAPDFASALLAHYTFDETNGTVAADSSGNGTSANLVNFPGDDSMWVSGQLGGALAFNPDGTAVNQLVTASALNLVNEDYFSFAFWARLDSTSNPNNPRLVTPVNTSGQIWVLWSPAYHGVGFYPPVPSPEPELQVWKHYVVTYDRLAGTYQVYVDGHKTAESTNPAYINPSPAGRQWVIGSSENLSTYFDPWRGTFDDFRIYNRVLFPGDVKALYANSGTGAPALSMVRSGGQVTISWPQQVTGYELQSNTNLTTTTWSVVPGVTANSITLTPSEAVRFFRLHRN
jgi:hypothetical protein